MIAVSYKHVSGAFLAAALGGTIDDVMRHRSPVSYVFEQLYNPRGGWTRPTDVADLAAKLRAKLRVKTVETSAMMYPMYPENMYHFSSERAPIVHARMCAYWGWCGSNDTPPT